MVKIFGKENSRKDPIITGRMSFANEMLKIFTIPVYIYNLRKPGQMMSDRMRSTKVAFTVKVKETERD